MNPPFNETMRNFPQVMEWKRMLQENPQTRRVYSHLTGTNINRIVFIKRTFAQL